MEKLYYYVHVNLFGDIYQYIYKYYSNVHILLKIDILTPMDLCHIIDDQSINIIIPEVLHAL